MTHFVAPSVNIFIIKGSKVLLSRRANTGWMDGMLCPPGGHVEKGEAPVTAALRELKEELGMSLRAEDLEFVCVAHRNTSPTEYVAYEFIVRDKNYDFKNAEPDLCSELVWVELHELPEDVIDDFRHIITRGVIGRKPFLELGYPPQAVAPWLQADSAV